MRAAALPALLLVGITGVAQLAAIDRPPAAIVSIPIPVPSASRPATTVAVVMQRETAPQHVAAPPAKATDAAEPEAPETRDEQPAGIPDRHPEATTDETIARKSAIEADDTPADYAFSIHRAAGTVAREQARAATARGTRALERGDLDAAAQHFSDALDVDPRAANAWAGLAIARDSLGDHPTALSAFERALQAGALEAELAVYAQRRIGELKPHE